MSSIRSVLVIFFFFAVIHFPSQNAAESRNDSLTSYVSMVKILVRPSEFEGKKISVVGYLSRAHSPALYLSKEHALLNDISSGIPVYPEDLSISDCMDRFVRITGKFISDAPNEFALAEIEHAFVTTRGDNISTVCSRPIE